jgi:hypothetical protein
MDTLACIREHTGLMVLLLGLRWQGGGPPAREPAVTEDERKAMMAFYFKK